MADLVFVAILCGLVFTPLSTRLLGDAGIGWHIRTGQQIIATHTVPRIDPFSSTMAGRPWFAWEWLYDVAVGYLDGACGLNGPVWLTALVIAATFSGMFRLLVRRGTNLFVAIVFLLLAVSASMIHFLARPHVLSWLLTLAWFWILDSTERSSPFGHSESHRAKLLWALPFLMVLWVNVHGGFILGFALLAIFWVSSLWTWWRLPEFRIEESLEKIAAGRRVLDLTFVGALTVLASLVNPYGWKLHVHIYSYLANRFLMNHIDEFQSPNFHGVAQRCFLVLLLVSIAALVARGRELRASGVLTILFSVYTALFASRNIPVSSVLLTMVLAPIVPHLTLLQSFVGRMQRVESQLRGHIWPALAVLGTLGVAANGGGAGSAQLMDARFDPQRMPVEAVDFLSTAQIKGPILSPDYWGGYVIYRLFPQTRVVLDDRHDLYGADFMRFYLRMIRVEDGWDTLLRQSDPACLLLPKDSPFANVLRKTAGWRSVYADPVSVVFVRDRAAP